MKKKQFIFGKQNKESLGALVWAMENAERGFFMLTAPNASTQMKIGEELLQQFENAAVFDFAKEGIPYSYAFIEKWAVENQDKDILILLNMQVGLKEKGSVSNLNLSRDMLAGLNKVWVFGVMEELEVKITKKAYDFDSYIRMRFRFTQEVFDDIFIADDILKYPNEMDGEKLEKLKEKSELLQKMLSELDGNMNENLQHIKMRAEKALIVSLRIEGKLDSATRKFDDLLQQVEALEEGNSKKELLLELLEEGVEIAKGQKRYEAARKYLVRIENLQEEIGAPQRDRIKTLRELAGVYLEQKDEEKARKLYTRILTLLKPELYPNRFEFFAECADVLMSLGEYAEAIEYNKKALSLLDEGVSVRSAKRAILQSISTAYLHLFEYDDYLLFGEEALSIPDEDTEKDQYSKISQIFLHGFAADIVGDYQQALKNYETALTKLAYKNAENEYVKKMKAYAHYYMGRINRVLGCMEVAEGHYEKSLEEFEPLRPQYFEQEVGVYMGLALICEERGRYIDAITNCHIALQRIDQVLPTLNEKSPLFNREEIFRDNLNDNMERYEELLKCQ